MFWLRVDQGAVLAVSGITVDARGCVWRRLGGSVGIQDPCPAPDEFSGWLKSAPHMGALQFLWHMSQLMNPLLLM